MLVTLEQQINVLIARREAELAALEKVRSMLTEPPPNGDTVTSLISRMNGDTSRHDHGDPLVALVDIVRNSGGHVTPKEIKQIVKKSDTWISIRLGQAVQAGMLVKERRGVYGLATNGQMLFGQPIGQPIQRKRGKRVSDATMHRVVAASKEYRQTSPTWLAKKLGDISPKSVGVALSEARKIGLI